MTPALGNAANKANTASTADAAPAADAFHFFKFFVAASAVGPGGSVAPAYREYNFFEYATVNIYPSPGYHIASISDNDKLVRISNPYEIRVFRDHIVKVTFAPESFAVTAAAPGGGGTVNPASQTVSTGHTAAIDITPSPGHHIQSITDNGEVKAIADPYYINNVVSDHDVLVTFAINTYAIAASVSGGHGTVVPPTQTVTFGATASIQITPEGGYQIATLTDNGVSVAPSSPYVINNVSDDHNVVVTFRNSNYMVAASVLGGHGSVSPETQIIASGDPASIIITADPGYHIGSVLDNNVSMPTISPYVIDHVTQDHSVVVMFVANQYTVDASVSGGHGTVDPSTQTVTYGGTAVIYISPDANCQIASIADNGEFVPIANPYVILVSHADHDVVVTFTPNKFTISAAAPAGGGTATPSSQTVAYGNAAAVDIIPDSGNVIAFIVDNGVLKLATDPYYIENVTQNHEVLSAFTHEEYPTWYLAEGSTSWGFSTYISIENPSSQDLTARLTYMSIDGTNQEQTVNLPAISQVTVNPAAILGAADFSTKVECLEGKMIAVDRTMSWTGPGAPSPEGHCSVGVTSPQKTWYLPEGSSDWGFETWVLVQNPNDVEADVTLTYMIEGVGPEVVEEVLPPLSRTNFPMVGDIGAADASISVSSNIPVIAERSMYRNNRREGHCSIGAAAPAETFYLAEGTTAWGFTTYVLLQNPSKVEANVTITYMTPTGPRPQPPFAMPPESRKTIKVNDVADVSNTDVSTMVQADVPIVAERAMYWGKGTPLGEACHASIGLASPYNSFYLPDGQTSQGYETYTLVQNPNDTPVRIEVTYLQANGAGQAGFIIDVAANSRQTFNMADTLPSVRASIKVTSLTPGKGILVERAMYWNNRGAGIESIGGYLD